MINTPPTHSGPFGKAWRVDIQSLKARWGEESYKIVSTDRWILFCPAAHPFWSWYLLSVVTLADVKGIPAAGKDHPNNTHEITVLALDPDHEPTDTLGQVHPMMGPNFITQVQSTNAALSFIMDKAAKDCTQGTLSPDSDFRRLWMHRFNPLMAQAEGLSAGVH